MADYGVPLPQQTAKRVGRRFASGRAIAALMLREMSTTYGRSVGGYFWAIAEPIAGIAIMTFAFGFFFSTPPIGATFEMFYATGMLPFLLFTTLTNRVGSAILFSRPLLAYPAVNFADAIIARFLTNLLTELLISLIVFSFILIFWESRVILDPAQIAKGYALAAAFGLGLGTLNCYLFLRFHLWSLFWSVINRPLFMISGVFFLYGSLPDSLKDGLWYNPLIHIVGAVRAGFYADYDGGYVSATYVIGVSLLLGLVGLFLLRRHGQHFIFEG